MRAPKNRNREDEAEKTQRKISNFSKKIPTWNFSKTIFNAFFAFSEEFIFFVPQIFFENHDFLFLVKHFSTVQYVF